LFPEAFDRNTSRPAPSFDVRDLDTADNVVLERLGEELQRGESQVVIAHFLGLDHAGHTYGPDAPQFGRKLAQLTAVVKDTVASVRRRNSSDLLLVMGDHGMTPDGNHGGASLAETRAAMLVLFPPGTERVFEEGWAQMDLAPTLSGLLGVPVPFGSLGRPMPQFFSPERHGRLVEECEGQVRRYLSSYGAVHGGAFPAAALRSLAGLRGQAYLLAASHMARTVWASFLVPRMAAGVATMLLVLLLWSSSEAHPSSTGRTHLSVNGHLSFTALALGAAVGPPLALLASRLLPADQSDEAGFFLAGLLVGPLVAQLPRVAVPRVLGATHMLVALQTVSLFSNSFLEAERQVAAMLLRSALLLLLCSAAVPRKTPLLLLLASCVFLPMFGGNSSNVGAALCVLLAAHWAWPQSRARLLLLLGVFVHFSAKVWQNELFAAWWSVRVLLPRAVLAASLFLPMFGGNVSELLEVWLVLLGGARGLLATTLFVALQNRAANVYLSAFPAVIFFLGRFCYFESGRASTFAALDVESGFLLGEASPHILCGILIFCNAVAPLLFAPRVSAKSARQVFFLQAVVLAGTAMCCVLARGHLMLVRVFAPHFVFETALAAASLAAALLAHARFHFFPR
jgi:hypothetical protein